MRTYKRRRGSEHLNNVLEAAAMTVFDGWVRVRTLDGLVHCAQSVKGTRMWHAGHVEQVKDGTEVGALTPITCLSCLQAYFIRQTLVL